MKNKKDSLGHKQLVDIITWQAIQLSVHVESLKRSQAMVLMGQLMVEPAFQVFSGLWPELCSGSMSQNIQAAGKAMRQNFESDNRNLSQCKEVEHKMDVDISNKVRSYIELIETIKEQTGDDTIAVAIFHEVVKEMRTENKSFPKKVYNSDSPATDKQIEYLKKLGVHIPEQVTRQQASDLIDQAQQWKNEVKQALKNPIRIPA